MKTKLTPSQRKTRRKHTRTVKNDDGHGTYMQIDHQRFCVVRNTTRFRARWFRDQLAIALDRLVQNERKP